VPAAPHDPWSWLPANPSVTSALVREVDWGATPLGPVETWSASLRTAVAMVLNAKHPMFLWWGPELVQIYNDAYMPSFGVGRHPAAMGQRGRACWSEIWHIIGPQIDGVMTRGEPTFHEDALVPIFRNGRLEEVYWTYGYSPVFEADGSIAATLVVVTETTARVVAARWLQIARALAEAVATVLDPGELDAVVIQTLAASPEAVPWAMIVRAGQVRAATGLDDAERDAVLAQLDATGAPVELSVPVAARLGGLWSAPSTRALALPIADRDYLVFGASPRLPFDAEYRAQLAGLTRQVVSAATRIDAVRARIEAERARTNLLLQAPVAAALLVGDDWRYEIANAPYEDLVGKAVVGHRWRDLFPQLAGGPVDEILRRVYTTGEPFFASEQLVPLARRSDGVIEDRYFDFNMIPIREPSGAVDAMMVIAVELTAQVRARRELEAASRAKDVFMAMLGHELRNPLSPIATAIEILKLRGDPGLARELGVIERHVAHVGRLVDDLLDISKVASGKVELRRAVAEVGEIVARAVELASQLIEARGHALAVEVAPGLWWEGDPTRLAQVIANLLTNAARYTDPRGRIDLAVARAGDDLVITVRDDGRGIDAALLPQLFDAFVQAPRTVDRQEGGLGLGLALVKGLVERHGGTVTAASAGLGRGSEFVVRVPGVTDRAPGAARPHPPAAAPRGRRVLVVDDNVDAAQLLAEVLTTAGYATAVAHDGPAALALAAEFAPDIAVLDIGLPVMDGYELVGRLRAQLGPTACRFFALTGYAQSHDRARTTAAGFEHHLVKPVSLRQLQALFAEPLA
jgi:signal transduction histidine kinase/CheY-like chemotaxis protein